MLTRPVDLIFFLTITLLFFLQQVWALDAVVVWQNHGCMGSSTSWLIIDDGKQQCNVFSPASNVVGISYHYLAADSKYQLLYLDPQCGLTTPHVTLAPTPTIQDSCYEFPVGSKRHFAAYQALASAAQTTYVPERVLEVHPFTPSGLSETPNSEKIFFGSTKRYVFGTMQVTQPHGSAYGINHAVSIATWHALRTKIRAAWQANTYGKTQTQSGVYADGVGYDLTISWPTGVYNPFSQFDNANAQLLSGILERLYYWAWNTRTCSFHIPIDFSDHSGHIMEIYWEVNPC